MKLDENQYHIEKERLGRGVVRFTCKPILQTCDTCKKENEWLNMTVVKYPVYVKSMKQRMIYDRNICKKCYPEIMQFLNNNKC